MHTAIYYDYLEASRNMHRAALMLNELRTLKSERGRISPIIFIRTKLGIKRCIKNNPIDIFGLGDNYCITSQKSRALGRSDVTTVMRHISKDEFAKILYMAKVKEVKGLKEAMKSNEFIGIRIVA